MPREPLTSTRSPGRTRRERERRPPPRWSATWTTAAAGMPAVDRARRPAPAPASPPTAISRSRPARRGRRAALVVQARARASPSSSISPSTAILRALPVAAVTVSSARLQRRRARVVRVVDQRDAAGQPQQLAAMRGRPQRRRRASAIASSGTSNCSATAVAASTFGEVAEPEQRRLDAHVAVQASCTRRRRAVEAAMPSTARRADVRCASDTERHDAAARTRRARARSARRRRWRRARRPGAPARESPPWRRRSRRPTRRSPGARRRRSSRRGRPARRCRPACGFRRR